MDYKINIKFDLKNTNNLNKIKKEFIELINLYINQNEKVAFYYEDINTGSIISYNSDILFYAASTIKILVCLIILEKASNKEINLNDKLLITMSELKQDTGIIKYQIKDTYYTIKELIRLSIIESDNTAYIKLVEYIKKENIKNYGKEIGAKYTLDYKDMFGIINCEDMIIYWKKIKDFIDNNIYGNLFYNYLSNPTYNIIKKESIGNNNFVKKYGSYDIAYHEAGYVEDINSFYMIILTQKLKCNDKEDFVNETAKKIYKIHKLIY